VELVVVSGGFDPVHSGHIGYFKAAKNYGDKLIVAINSDDWLKKKKGKPFLPFDERKAIVESIKYVDEVISFEDDKLGSCINALKKVKKKYPNDNIIFANGGDRNESNIPEMEVANVKFIFNVGGKAKKNSSSWILNQWQYYYEERQWGSFYNLFQSKNIKVKELIIDPGKSMSIQRHEKRNEIWLISDGACVVNFSKNESKNLEEINLNKFDHFIVSINDWHQITNPYESTTHIIEIQYGEECIEDDIVRLK
jgi:cytidyltransferase-like protein